MIVDSFLDDYEWFRLWCDRLEYETQTNPVDGVDYPGINTQIPVGIAAEMITKLQKAVRKRIYSYTAFLRLSTEGEAIPHQAHTDSSMGDYVMLLYMNREEDCQGGTAFIRHKETGLDTTPVNDQETAIWRDDTNNYDAWNVLETVEMKPNRAFIFEADKMHRAQMPNAFGSNATDGRLVMTCFFKVFND